MSKLRGVAEEDVFRALQEVELIQVAEREISSYSYGMLKRLGIAKAILGNPELIVLDEPTSGLDPIGRRKLIKLIKRLHKERETSFLISSHVLTELQRVCSWVCLMYNGNIIEQDFVDNLVRRYSSKTYVIKVSDPEKLVAALKSVKNLKIKTRGNLIYLKGDASTIQNDVVKLVVQTNNNLMLFSQVGISLEDIFVKILEKEDEKQQFEFKQF